MQRREVRVRVEHMGEIERLEIDRLRRNISRHDYLQFSRGSYRDHRHRLAAVAARRRRRDGAHEG
jgi:hypothetical protein